MTCLCRHRGEVEALFHPILNPAPEGGGLSTLHSRLITSEKEQVPIVQEAGWALGLVWMAQKISLLLGFNPQTIQPIVSCYTNYTILAAQTLLWLGKYSKCIVHKSNDIIGGWCM
jgi:hypothetical protein